MKKKLTDILIFAVLLLVITHMSIGLGELSTFGWTLLGVMFAIFVIVETVVDVGFDWVFVKLGLKSGGGPLSVTATEDDEGLVITMRNDGKSTMSLAIVEGLDQAGKSVFATMVAAKHQARINGEKVNVVREPAQKRLRKGQSTRLVLDGPLIAQSGYQTLQVLDSNGECWPVQWARKT